MSALALATTTMADLVKALADADFASSRRMRESEHADSYELGLLEGSHSAFLLCERLFRNLAEVES